MAEDRPDFDEVFRERVEFPNPVLFVIWRYGGRYRLLLGAGLVTAAASPILNFVPPYLLGTAVDAIAGGPDAFRLPFAPAAWIPTGLRGQLILTFVLLTGSAIAMLAMETVDSLLWSRIEYDIAHELRTDAYDATQRHGMSFFETAQTGDVMSVLNQDLDRVANAPSNWLKSAYTFGVFVLALGAVMISMHWQLALVALAFGVPLGVTSYVFHRRIDDKYTDVWRDYGRMNARLEGGISGISTVKSYANEPFEHERLVSDSRRFHDGRYDVHLDWSYWSGFNALLERGSTLAVLVIGGWIVMRGPPTPAILPISVGVFVTFFLYAQRFSSRLSGMGQLVYGYDRTATAARRVFGLMHYPVAIREADDPIGIERVEGSLAFADVTFTYPGTDRPAVQELSFTAETGNFVGLVGQTGAGKSTIVRLLLRFYDPEHGAIRLDSHDIRDIALADLRGAIGYVEQEPFLFDDTVRNNLTYANREETEAEMIEAAKRARAHEFIVELPDGYDTEIGERGVKLSGGQRQRLVIARTLLEDPPILILDEATSHVDNRTELLIQDALEELTADRTTIAIAHRLSTVRNADQLLVLEDGKIVERGTHEGLLEGDGVYARLWRSHVGERRARE